MSARALAFQPYNINMKINIKSFGSLFIAVEVKNMFAHLNSLDSYDSMNSTPIACLIAAGNFAGDAVKRDMVTPFSFDDF